MQEGSGTRGPLVSTLVGGSGSGTGSCAWGGSGGWGSRRGGGGSTGKMRRQRDLV